MVRRPRDFHTNTHPAIFFNYIPHSTYMRFFGEQRILASQSINWSIEQFEGQQFRSSRQEHTTAAVRPQKITQGTWTSYQRVLESQHHWLRDNIESCVCVFFSHWPVLLLCPTHTVAPYRVFVERYQFRSHLLRDREHTSKKNQKEMARKSWMD